MNSEDITTCQQQYQKKIILSIGGATSSETGFSSVVEASSAADAIWEMFGPRQPQSSALRPFDDATVNGFDFDFESSVSNMAAFGNRLRTTDRLLLGDLLRGNESF